MTHIGVGLLSFSLFVCKYSAMWNLIKPGWAIRNSALYCMRFLSSKEIVGLEFHPIIINIQSKNETSILIQFSPSTHLIRFALQVSTRWGLQMLNGEQNISWVSYVYWLSTRWALGENWQRCLRRCALGEYCTCLEVCTRWALDLNNLCRWILDEYWT